MNEKHVLYLNISVVKDRTAMLIWRTWTLKHSGKDIT